MDAHFAVSLQIQNLRCTCPAENEGINSKMAGGDRRSAYVEVEIVKRIIIPLARQTTGAALGEDVNDKDIGRVAKFCSRPDGKPPEIGVFSHFLQTTIHSKSRRENSPLIRIFLSLLADWPGSNWVLEPSGLHNSLVTLTSKFRNRAAHIDELDKADYDACRDLVAGANGMVWRLILASQSHRNKGT